MNLRNFKFDSRLDGIDEHGNPIRGGHGKKKKNKVRKSLMRNNPAEMRRREEECSDREDGGTMRFSLNGIYYEPTVKEAEFSEIVDNDGRENRHKNDRSAVHDRHEEKSPGGTIDKAIADLTEFVTTYNNKKIDTPVAKSIIATGFANVANIMSHYNDDNWKKALPAMTNVIILMSSENFSRTLKIVLSEGSLVTMQNTKEDIMRLFNLALDYNIDIMSDDVLSTYVDIITNLVADIDIKMMTEKYGMDEDTALNFIVSIPICVTGVKNDVDIRQYARRFIEEVIRESDETIKYMDHKCQKTLFYDIFRDKKGLGVIKAVGQCMTSSEITIPVKEGSVPDPAKVALVDEYIMALYEIMDEHDIPTIQIALKFIVKELKRRDEAGDRTPIVFNVSTALEYSNIRKAIIDLVNRNRDAAQYLDN